ncbi:MAG: tail fiber domain-containing protein [Prevotellaceae bacterium]|jgi:hypothetical protein|nr:tail fiber domain-containing protein [Prevotellaceae bacterium]
MKTNLFSTLCLVFALCAHVNAQIKVFSNGTIAALGATTNGGFSSNIGGWGHQFGMTYQGEFRYLRFQVTTYNPRISGTHDCVVFYSADNSSFQDIQVKNVYQYSDRGGKTNILPLFNSLDKVKSLNPVSFNWKNDTASFVRTNSSGSPLQEVGFIAQDVEQVLPDLVILDEEGNKLVNYVAVIPVLVDAVKELNGKVEKLEQEVAVLKSRDIIFKSDNEASSADSVEALKPVLYQNIPNPSSGETRIQCSIPAMRSTSYICVFNLSGELILKKAINSAGDGEIVINANALKRGMYIYSLLVDDELIDTKRMVLTE